MFFCYIELFNLLFTVRYGNMEPLMRPVVIMDSHNSSSDNYTSERPDYDYYSYENSNNDSNNANTVQLLTQMVIGQKEK